MMQTDHGEFQQEAVLKQLEVLHEDEKVGELINHSSVFIRKSDISAPDSSIKDTKTTDVGNKPNRFSLQQCEDLK